MKDWTHFAATPPVVIRDINNIIYVKIDDEKVVGENVLRFNDREDLERIHEKNENHENSLNYSKVIIRKSMIGTVQHYYTLLDLAIL